LPPERLRYQPEAEWTRQSLAEWLLLELLDLLGRDLDQLLELLELRGDDLQQLLNLPELLQLEELHLLELLGHGLQPLQKVLRADRLTRERLKVRLLRKRLNAESLTGIRREAPRGIRRWCSDSERRSCWLTHLTSSVRCGPHSSSTRTGAGCREVAIAFT
jgi:hypothetical protein